jgi:hypothetical protein
MTIRIHYIVVLPVIALFLGLLATFVVPAIAATSLVPPNVTAEAASCSFNGRNTAPRIYNDGGVQGTIHIKRRDGSQISIGVGASARVCPYRMWLDHRNEAVVRCGNRLTYWVESTWYNAFRRMTEGNGKNGYWICAYLGGSGTAHISTQRE